MTACHVRTFYSLSYFFARTGKENECWELRLAMALTGIDLYHLSCLKLGPKSKRVKQDPVLVSR